MFGFPKTDRAIIGQFKDNFLRSCVFQIKYPKNESILLKENYILDVFGSTLPRKNEIKGKNLQVAFTESHTPIFQSFSTDMSGLEMKSNDGLKVLTVTDDTITYTISGKAYKNFDTISLELRQIEDIIRHNNIDFLTRIAIRKINILDFRYDSLEASPMDIVKMILNPALVHGISYFPNINFITQNVNTVSYSNQENNLNIVYGLVNQLISNENQGQIVIDIDLFKEGILNENSVTNCFTEINGEIFNIFNWAISENAKTILTKK